MYFWAARKTILGISYIVYICDQSGESARLEAHFVLDWLEKLVLPRTT